MILLPSTNKILIRRSYTLKELSFKTEVLMAHVGKNKHIYTHSTIRIQEPTRRSYDAKRQKKIWAQRDIKNLQKSISLGTRHWFI